MADAGGGEAYYRSTADALSRDNALLRERVDKLEKANRQLMRSVFELSTALSAAQIPPPPLHIIPDEDPVVDDRPSVIIPKTTSSDAPKKVEAVATVLSAAVPPTTPGETVAPVKLVFAEKHEWGGHRGAVYALSFSAGGRVLAAAGFDRALRLWDVAKGEAAATLSEAHSGPVSDMSWSADSNEILTGGLDSRVKLWDTTKTRLSGQWDVPSFVAQIAQHPPEPHLFAACGGEKGVVFLFDRRSPVPARRLHDGEVVMSAVCFTRSGELVCGDADGMLRLWDWKRDGPPLRKWNASGEGAARATVTNIYAGSSPGEADDRCLLVNSYDNAVRLWRRADSAEACKLVHTLQGVKGRHWPIRGSLQLAKDARGAERWLAASGSADGSVLVWDLLSKGATPSVQQIAAHAMRCYAAEFHPTEPMFASCSADGVVKIFAPKS